jgi:FKBP-type peptidyl-prolyl cis-trans isomerase
MRGLPLVFLSIGLTSLVSGSIACKRPSDEPSPATGSGGVATGSGKPRSRGEQVVPPLPLQPPPADAIKTASGLIYKKLDDKAKKPDAKDPGPLAKRNDTVLINYTGWRQASGETFFSNRGRGQPMPLNLSQAAPGFVEGLQLLHKGESAMLWLPPEIGYKTPPTTGKPETLVYQVEVADIIAAPAVPDDVAKPPAKAEVLPSGMKRLVVKPATGKDKARQFDNVTFNYTAWDDTGRMIDTTETRKRPPTAPPYKQAPAMAEMLTSMASGERARFWVDAANMIQPGVKPLSVQQGTLCYEVEVSQVAKAEHEPPPTPADVAKPPADAKKTAKGTFYKLLKAGSGKDPRHPEAKDTVKVHYTGWTTDGRMFDSSVLRGEPATFNLGSVVAGWTDGIPVMTIGDRVRFWIPQELAYKGQAGKPAGMLVFDVELIEIVAPTAH